MDMSLFKVQQTTSDAPECVVRLRTSYRRYKNELIMTKNIRILNRKSTPPYCVLEDVVNTSPQDVIPRIVNLNEVDDGLYYIITVNETKDWESGIIDDWDYKLIPYIE